MKWNRFQLAKAGKVLQLQIRDGFSSRLVEI